MDRAETIAYDFLLRHRDARWQDQYEALAQVIRQAELRGRKVEHDSPNLPRDFYGGAAMSQPDGHP